MTQIKENLYPVRIEYDPETEGPSRLFHSLGELIESFKKSDEILAASIGAEIKVKQYLKSVEDGSIIAWIKNKIEIPDQNTLSHQPTNVDVETFLNNGKQIIVESLNKNKSFRKKEDFTEVKEKLKKNASNTNNGSDFNYKEIDTLALASNIKSITDAVKKLNANEKAFIGNLENKSEIPKDTEIFISEIRESFIAETIESEGEKILKIKRIDFLGESMWDFKFGTTPIPAKINDEKWMKKFHNREINLYPGDALHVLLKTKSDYDKRGSLILEHNEVLKVIKIIPNLDKQPGLYS
ncbi:hypothetical protein ACO2KH_18255 [Leptospira terpstrae]|uniref:hypothetical protein n=1 Tax=Leptospira terpstrae TaxID=293075 RepID=UPI003D01C513